MEQRATDFSTLTAALCELVARDVTGTLFVATADNHAAQIVLVRGQLLGVACDGRCNAQALALLAERVPLRFSFTPELVYPLPDTLLPEQSRQLLQQLGPVPATAAVTPEAAAEAAAPAPAVPAQALRVYRGQVVKPSRD